MEQRFKEGLTKLLNRQAPGQTILAVSGGIDSVVMAYLYHAGNIPFSIAHCNFQLRGKESTIDQEFVQALGDKLEARVFVENFDTEKFAKEKGISMQMAARKLRYRWFARLAVDFEAKIAIAHHANDVAETLLFNLTKGTGLAGLHGIADKDGYIIRPLLWAKKTEITDYAGEKGIIYREDQSNESEKYMRNIIRKKVIPELERVNPSFVTTSLRNAARIKDAEKFIHHAIQQLGISDERDGHYYINKEALRHLPGSRAVLYELIHTYGFNYEQVIAIESSMSNTGAIFSTDEWVLNIDRDHLVISKHEHVLIEQLISQEEEITDFETFELRAAVIAADGYQLNPKPQVAAFDLDKLNFPLKVRNWQRGDYFIPLGMDGKKKISDLLIDEKIPVNLKRNTMVVLSGNNIIWVIGLRIDNRYKLTPATKSVYQLEQIIN